MGLALSIFFIWAGCALLTVAFHPIHTENLTMPDGKHALGGTTILKSVQGQIGTMGSAYNTP
jgi:hypothetical protein